MQPLPLQAYRYVDIKRVKVNIDYHVQYEQHHYSVPHHYVGEKLELHGGDTLIQIYFHQTLVASHPRKYQAGVTTEAGHMPKQHSQQHKWTPERLKQWASSIGDNTLQWVTWQLETKTIPNKPIGFVLGY